MGVGLDTAMEWLRPFANANPWDYVVVWKLGDDPSRFIQWVDCCCSGGGDDENDVVGSGLVEEWCRDEFVKHRVKTRACTTLAHLPLVIPLYSGIHGDVATSEKPVWTTSVSDNEGNGTQVLIPVPSGLIEFFSSKNVPRDEKMISYVLAQFQHDIVMDNLICNPWLCSYNYPENWPIHGHNFLHQPNNCSSFEGSSSCSSLSNEHQVHPVPIPDPNQDRDPFHSQGIDNLRLKRKKGVDSVGKEKPGAKNRQEKGPYKSKNLVTERNRRERIKAGVFALRSLVPKITKMDRASTLGDAADYIEELHHIIDDYNHQLVALDGDEKCNHIDAKPNIVKPVGDDKKVNSTTKMEVEVKQVGTKNFLLKIVCEYRRGGFSKLMEAIDTLGYRVMDANVTTLNGLVSNVVRVEGGHKEEVDDHDPKALEYLLVQLVN